MKRIYLFLTAVILAAFAVPAAAQTTTAVQPPQTSGADLIPYKTLVEEYGLADLGYRTGSDLEITGTAAFHNGNAYTSTMTTDGSRYRWALGTNKYYGDIIVPENVTSLSKNSTGTFQCSYITTCKIPAGLTTVGDAAFADCPYLESITVAEGNNNFVTIDDCLYKLDNNDNPTTLVAVPGSKAAVTIDSRVTTIGNSALDGCRNIKELTISSTTLNSIGTYGFADMNLDKLVVYAENDVPDVTGTTFENCNITAIYVDADLVDDYKAARYWRDYNIYPIEDIEVAGSFEVVAELTKILNEDNEVAQIVELKVTGANGETFADEIPTGWTFTHQNGTEYEMTLELSADKKSVIITFPDQTINTTGKYTLNVTEASLKTDGGDLCNLYQKIWVIEEAEVITKNVKRDIVLYINDSDESFSWKYKDDTNTEVSSPATHIIGNTLYIKTDDGVHDINTNTTTFTTTEYYSSKADYKRTFKNNKWQALYVPFDLVYDKLALTTLEIAVITGVTETVDKDNNVVWFYVTAEILEAGQTIPANTPCVIRSIQQEGITVERSLSLVSGTKIDASGANVIELEGNKGNKYRFTGQYTKTGIKDNDMTYAMAGGALKQPTQGTTVSLGAYRWYLEINPSDENATATFSFGRFDNEGTTGVEEVKTENGNMKGIYDLQGRKIDEISKPGLYIVDGKKVLVK
ncbi:MAG: leucine-rich repeat domain-containing protein [Bacteroidaceae bacterium]|nr:leucine-rich repeat domain-containing protein [Bacteroidaceae bacterium]